MHIHVIPFREKKAVIEPTGRLWPNGEFTIGYSVAGSMERESTHAEIARGMNSHLGLSLPSISHSPSDEGKAPKGTKGLTGHGKKVLRNAVGRIQGLYGKRRLSFVTLTLPNLTYEQHWYISSNWSQIVRVFFQKLGRHLESAGLPVVYASCTEMQPGRCESEEVPALHLHFVCVGRSRSGGAWAFSPVEFRRMWASVLQLYVGEIEDTRALENVQMVKKDASSYMAKYVSKGCSLDTPPRSDETGWSLPTSWYNVNLKLRRWVLENIRRSPELMNHLERMARNGSLGGFCHYFFAGVIEESAGPGPHYFVGKLKGEFMNELISTMKEIKASSA